MLRRTFLKTAPALTLLTACSKSPNQKLALNWKPEPEFGGFYAAPYPKHGLTVDILPGGSGTPTVQMIGANSVDFGIVSADEIILARSHGNDVVALFAVFQDSPTGIMAHASRNLKTIADVLKDSTLAIESGLPFARLMKRKYGFDHVKIVPSPGGDITSFLHDPTFAQQCYLTSEPLVARHKGADVQVFAVSEIGYDPYTTVLATSGELLRKNPDRAKSMVAAVRDGWRSYLADPKETNQQMHQLNPTMDLDTFAEVAEAQKQFIGPIASLGAMTRDRWQTLIAQFQELGDITQTISPDDCFRNLF